MWQTWKRHFICGVAAGGIVFLIIGILNGVALYWSQVAYLQGIAPQGGMPPEARNELARSSLSVGLAYLYDTGFGILIGALWGSAVGLFCALARRTDPPARFSHSGLSARGAHIAFHAAVFPTFFTLGIITSAAILKGYITRRPETAELVRWIALGLVVYLVVSYALYRLCSLVLVRVARIGLVRTLARPRTAVWVLGGLSALVILGSAVPSALSRSPRTHPSRPRHTSVPRSPLPNVLLLVLDTTRADHLSCYGYPLPTTPNIDRLATQGVLYERAYSPAVWTLAGHASIFTSQFPSRHGANGEHLYLDPQAVTMAEILAAAGYRTAGFSNNAWVSEWTGLAQGFETMRQMWSKPYNTQFILASMAYQFLKFAATGNQAVGGVLQTNKEALKWIDDVTRGDAPFFCFVNYMEAHPPLDYRPRFTEPFKPDALSASEVARVDQNPYAVWARKIVMSEESSRAYAALYDGELRYLDTHIQALLDGLQARGILDDTVIIITADHGEALGEHGHLGHHFSLLEGILRVPLIVRYPKVFPAGMRVAEPVQTVDILPTLLDILGLHEPRFEAQFQGRLLPPLEPSGRAMTVIAEEMRPLLELRFVKALRPDFDVAQRYDRVHRALISGWAKYIWSSDGNHELYDLFSDPQENRNIYTSRRREAMRLEERLRAWLSTFTPYDTASAAYTFQPPDRQTREQLKSLGYIQ